MSYVAVGYLSLLVGRCVLNSVAFMWITAVFLVTVSLRLLSTFTDRALIRGRLVVSVLHRVPTCWNVLCCGVVLGRGVGTVTSLCSVRPGWVVTVLVSTSVLLGW